MEQNKAMTIERQILNAAESLSTFTVVELKKYLGDTRSLAHARLNWYLSKLTDEGMIVRIARGHYAAKDSKIIFTPQPSQDSVTLYNQFHEVFPEISICVYEGPWIFQFMHHLASNQVTYIEVEKDIAETVFHTLKDQGKAVFLRPDKDLIYKYVNMDQGVIFVKNLTSESPLQSVAGIKVPTLEKLLVDMYVDPDFFYLQGSEYNRIMHNVRTHYVINQSRMLRYARRRNVSERIKNIFESSHYDID